MIKLKLTCHACPEQYEAFDNTGAQVGYLRLRHGQFTVECPAHGGELVYKAAIGDGTWLGEFQDEDERRWHLHKALDAIEKWRAPASLGELQKEVCTWAATIWGDSRPPDGCIIHLQQEAKELEEAPYDPEEYADCLILLLNAAGLAGLSTDDLMEAAWRKHEVNKARKWGSMDAKDVSEHIADRVEPPSITA